MILKTLIPLEPPSKEPSENERKILGQLRYNNGKWFVVAISSKNDFALSFLNKPEIAYEVGKRALLDLPVELTQQLPANDLTHAFVLWARYSDMPSKNATAKISSGGTVYPNEVRELCQRFYDQCVQFHPDVLDEAMVTSEEWLSAMDRLHKKNYDAVICDHLDYVFGSPDGSAPNVFWSGVVTHVPGFVNNFNKIVDAKKTDARMARARMNPKSRKRPGLDRSKI